MPKRGPIVPLPQKPKPVPKPKAAPVWHSSAADAPTPAPAASKPKTAKKKRDQAAERVAQKKAGSGAGAPAHPGKKAREKPEDVLAPAVLAAEARCWDPDVEHEASIALPDVGTLSHEPLAVEARRVAGLRRLRLSFGEATRKLQLRPPPASGAFERWHFGWLLSASGAAADPLLPRASSAAADAALSAELELVGATPAAAAAVVGALSRDAAKEAEAMAGAARAVGSAGQGEEEGGSEEEERRRRRRRKKAKHAPEAEAAGPHRDLRPDLDLRTDLALSSAGGLVHLQCAAAAGGLELALDLKLAPEHLAKLRAMHARVRRGALVARAGARAGAGAGAEAEEEGAGAEEALFCTDLARLLLRCMA